MDKSQLHKITNELQEWCEERRLSKDMQRKNITANLLEEITEYLRADSDLERIDALCDIVVFTMNSFDVKEVMVKHSFYYSDKFTLVGKLLALITSLNTHTIENEENLHKITYSIVALCEEAVELMGYNFYECMRETIKEINSRTGEYNKKIGKFVKYEGAYSKKEALSKINPNYEITKEDKHFWYYAYEGEIEGKLVKWYKANYKDCFKVW